MENEERAGSPSGEVKAKDTEAMVLTDQSLGSLAKDLGQSGLAFCMFLNIPNTRVVKAKVESNSRNLGEMEFYDATKNLLMYWKYHHKKGCKEREKIADIHRAFQQWGRHEWADLFMQKHKENEEILPETFSELKIAANSED